MPSRTVTLYAAGAVQLRKLNEVTEAMAAYSTNDVAIRRVTDLSEMARDRVEQLPAVAVDGEVVCSGRVPTSDELRIWVNPPAAE